MAAKRFRTPADLTAWKARVPGLIDELRRTIPGRAFADDGWQGERRSNRWAEPDFEKANSSSKDATTDQTSQHP